MNKLCKILVVFLPFASIGQDYQFTFEPSIGLQSLTTTSTAAELVGSFASEIEIQRPVLSYNFGLAFRKQIKQYFYSTSITYKVEDFNFSQNFIYGGPPDPNIPRISETTQNINKRQISLQVGFGVKSKSRSPDYWYIETGPLIEFNISSQINPLLDEHPTLSGFGTFLNLGYSFMPIKAYKSDGLILDIALSGAYNFEKFNIDIDNFIGMLKLGIGYTW